MLESLQWLLWWWGREASVSLWVFFPSTMGARFTSSQRAWKWMPLMWRNAEFAAKLLPKPRGTWRAFVVAFLSAGKGRLWNLCGLPIAALALDLVRRSTGGFGKRALSSQEPWVCQQFQVPWWTCLNPVLLFILRSPNLWRDFVKIRHSCCNPRALIFPRLYSHYEVDRKLLAFICDFQKINGNWSPPHLFASVA